MAKELKDFKFCRVRPGKYDWDKWLNGKAWALEIGKDFTTSVACFRVNAYVFSKKQGKHLRTEMKGDKLIIQAFPIKEDS